MGYHLKKSTWLGISSPKTTNHLNNFRFKGNLQSNFKENSSSSKATGATLAPSLEVSPVTKGALEEDSKVALEVGSKAVLGEDSNKVALEEGNKEASAKEIKGDTDNKEDKDLDREIKVAMEGKDKVVKVKADSDRDREARDRPAVITATLTSNPQAMKIPIRVEEARATSMSDLNSWTSAQ